MDKYFGINSTIDILKKTTKINLMSILYLIRLRLLYLINSFRGSINHLRNININNLDALHCEEL